MQGLAAGCVCLVMKTFTAIACFATTLVASTLAHAETQTQTDAETPAPAQTSSNKEKQKVVVGLSVGESSQSSGFLLIENHANLMETQLHVGYLPNAWIELEGALELGTGDGLRSTGAFADVRSHLFPMLPVNPTLVLGAGKVKEQGTAMGDDASEYRTSFLVGTGLESHIGAWTASFDIRIMVVTDDDNQMYVTSNAHNVFAHDAILSPSAKLGLSRSF